MNVRLARLLQTPSVVLLFMWMIVPLSMTIYFSTIRYNLLYPERSGFIGFENYDFFLTDPGIGPALLNTLVLVGSVLLISVVVGLALAMLVNQPFFGRGVVRVMLISPFFIMPTVNALVWKNMFMNPVYGIFAVVSTVFGFEPVDWLDCSKPQA